MVLDGYLGARLNPIHAALPRASRLTQAPGLRSMMVRRTSPGYQ
jgi:hypothetical protein